MKELIVLYLKSLRTVDTSKIFPVLVFTSILYYLLLSQISVFREMIEVFFSMGNKQQLFYHAFLLFLLSDFILKFFIFRKQIIAKPLWLRVMPVSGKEWRLFATLYECFHPLNLYSFLLIIPLLAPLVGAHELLIIVGAVWIGALFTNGVSGLIHYFLNTRNYRLGPGIQKLSKVSLYRLEWIAIIRNKRVKHLVLYSTVIMLFYCYYLVFSTNDEMMTQFLVFRAIIITMTVLPSANISQYFMGVEANFFPYLQVTPFSFRQFFRMKYLFYCTLSLIMFILISPIFYKIGFSWYMIVSMAMYSALINGLLLCMVFFSRVRLKLNESAWFNYQGVSFLPLLIILSLVFGGGGLYAFLERELNFLVFTGGLTGLFILFLLLLNPFFQWLQKYVYQQKYNFLTTYRKLK